MARIKMSAPWDIFYRAIDELFKEDPDIQIVYNEETKEIKLYVEPSGKATALNDLLPTEMTYGNVTQKITVVPANGFAANGGDVANKFDTATHRNGWRYIH